MHAESAHEMPGCESSCYKVCESGDKGGRARILGADMRGYEGDFSETAGKQLRQQGIGGDSTAGNAALLYAPNWQAWHSVSVPRVSS